MRRLGIVITCVATIALSFGLGRYQRSRSGGKALRRVMYYVDPMHPAYKSDKPGIAPDCGMQLEPVFADDPDSTPLLAKTLDPLRGAASISRATQRLVGIRLATVMKSGDTRIIRVVGRVVPEDTRVYKINSGVDGFIRETFSDSVGTVVLKDQKLATYYAPDFVTAASGFLAATERVPGSVSNEGMRSIQNYTDRLRNLGMSDLQIKRVASQRKLPESVDVVAPAGGVIVARNVSPGQHFEHDMELYQLADLARVWIVAEIDEQDRQYLRPGGVETIIAGDAGSSMSAHITNSLPQSEATGSTVKLRLEAVNSNLVLRPDMLVDVELTLSTPPGLRIPVDALIDSGTGARVYVEEAEGIFEPRKVQPGWRSSDMVEIRKGLRAGERVAVGATFLVDSESRLQAPPSHAEVETLADMHE